MGFGSKELLIFGLMLMMPKCLHACSDGFMYNGKICIDSNECKETPSLCGDNANCFNTIGSYHCQCKKGFRHTQFLSNFTAENGQCTDYNECLEHTHNCSHLTQCENLIGSYRCNCRSGYINESGLCEDINECAAAENKKEEICGQRGICKNTDGSYWCKCPKGYTNYNNKKKPCTELDCGSFSADSGPAQLLGGLAEILSLMRNSCLALSTPSSSGEVDAHGETLLEKVLTATDAIKSPALLSSTGHVSALLSTLENSIKLIGPQLKDNLTKMEAAGIDAQVAIQKGKTRPTGPIHLADENARLDTDWETATGTGTYPGYAMAALLSYKNLAIPHNGSFEELEKNQEDGVDPSFMVVSRVVSVVVSNPSTQHLHHPVKISLRHLQEQNESKEVRYICAYWNEKGFWSKQGLDQQQSNASHTVCTSTHLSSFAVLVALYPMEHSFALRLLTKIGLTISILCLILSILTFKFCRSIQGTRTTIHLHLCICLLVADVVFLAGISRTKPVGGCRFVAALLHYFFLAVFTWMLLEGVQLYRMVVRVFNANIQPLYLFLTGYGMPLVVVIISAISRPSGYGTDQHCWLSVKDGLIWSFYGPLCFIIILNVYFFIITVWKLAQKFTSLNPDLSKLHKFKAFTVTAIAQMCILGLMWVFGAFLFDESTAVLAYIFTILNSLQGALVFIMHCLLSKQVRDDYAHFLSCICTRQPKKYSDLSTTNPSSSQSQGSQSRDHTGESQI
ncbi:CD97 antigen [Echeneis naucrates]|uniref:CD97 antigen-like n=1 Tax=Echeneis naucrates TaxID=173247 RepID=A0A665WLM8_ECHNA|nr:CD97 antigen-like [Echeneis naucrates]